MSAREWKPGDVALIQWDGDTEMLAVRVASSCPIAGHANAGHWHTARGTHGQFPDHARPLVVIDPESDEDVTRLHEQVAGCVSFGSLRDALREFADPKPPRPEEPTGLGAVIEDTDGDLWVRSHIDVPNEPWTRPHLSGTYAYAVIDVVRVLSPGYDPEATS